MSKNGQKLGMIFHRMPTIEEEIKMLRNYIEHRNMILRRIGLVIFVISLSWDMIATVLLLTHHVGVSWYQIGGAVVGFTLYIWGRL